MADKIVLQIASRDLLISSSANGAFDRIKLIL